MVVYFDFDKQLDLPVVLDILDRLAFGFFWVSFWLLHRLLGRGQDTLVKVSGRYVLVQSTWVPQFCTLQSNTDLEVASWLAQQALRCATRKVFLALIVSEDFGGDIANRSRSPAAGTFDVLVALHVGGLRLASLSVCGLVHWFALQGTSTGFR